MEPNHEMAAENGVAEHKNDSAMMQAQNPVPMQDLSGLTYEMQEKIGKQNAMFKEKCDEKEMPLSAEEMNRDLTKMEALDLGDHKNYKTRLIQNRWEQ